MSEPLGFLISDVSRLMRRRFDERARRLNLTRAQWRTLVVLSRNEGSNQGQLADLLDVEPITLCRMVDRLEEAGHVERRRDPSDRRVWRIYLTDAARPLLESLKLVADDVFEDAMSGISSEDRDQLFAALEIVRRNLSDPSSDVNEAAHG
jgi:DNA-binding MarR family transcriptional regulator